MTDGDHNNAEKNHYSHDDNAADNTNTPLKSYYDDTINPDIPKQHTNPTTKQAAHQAPHKYTSRYITILPLLMILIIFLLALNANYEISRLSKLQQRQQNNLNLKLDTLKQQYSNIEHNSHTATQTLHSSQLELETKLANLDKQLQTALQQRFYHNQDWLLFKARYYLELAQINAHWSENQDVAITLLQQADTILQTMSSQELLPIRQAISQEIAQLKVIPVIDTVGLLSQLDGAQSILAELPIKQQIAYSQSNKLNHTNIIDSNVTKQSGTNITSLSSWKKNLQNSLRSLEKLVIIKRYDKNIDPMLSPLHQALLRDIIGINIKEAQWAILQNNPGIYRYSLTAALNDIQKIFDTQAKSTQSLIEQLHLLQQQTFNTHKPTIDQSLLLLNQLIDSKHGHSNHTLDTSTSYNEGNDTP